LQIRDFMDLAGTGGRGFAARGGVPCGVAALLLCIGCAADVGTGPHGDPDAAAGPADAQGSPDAAPAGTLADPIPIPSLPFSDDRDTTGAPAQLDAYSPCAPGTNEGGGEWVYRLELAAATTILVTVDDVSGDQVDIDVHLLDAPQATSCVARDNVTFTQAVGAGTYWIVADTWVDGNGTALAGPYHLTVEEVSAAADCLTSPITCSDGDAPLVNGVPTEPAGLGGCPAGMTLAGTVCVDRWEAALVLIDAAPAPWSPYLNPGSHRVRAVSAPGLVPQGYISQVQAAAACAEAGKRMCSDAEWLRACQGSAGTTYPYGDTRQPGTCNDDRTCHPAVQYFETTASWIWSELGNSCINQLPDGLAATGSYTGCVSADGAYDMMGNLHEWTADPAGTFRGGFYVDTVVNGPGCLYATTAHDVSHWDYSTGFRCCADP